jgi:hypothetical protein
MNIDILSSDDKSSEYKAAKELEYMLAHSVSQDIDGQLYIASNLTLSGQRVRDIDIAIWGNLSNYILPNYYSNDESRYPKKDLEVQSFFVVIELKEKSIDYCSLDGTHIWIDYGGEFKDVTHQNENQRYAMKTYLQKFCHLNVFVSNFIWLNSVTDEELEEMANGFPVGALPSYFGLEDIIEVVINQGMKPRYDNNNKKYYLSVGEDSDKLNTITQKMFTKQKVHSKLTRKKLEILAKQDLPDILETRDDDTVLINLKGKAGTGKTIILLKVAYQLISRENDISCALLTYNHALVNDIRRLMYYFDIRDNAIEPGTLHSFFMSLMKDLSIDTSRIIGYFFDQNYKRCLEELHNRVINANDDDAKKLRRKYSYILIDEAQDWHPFEKDILLKIYGPSRLFVADGGRQIVRNNEYLQWGGEEHPLDKGRRQKKSLVKFVNAIAEEKEIGWEQRGDGRLVGGRVIIRRDYDKNLHSQLTDYCKQNNCENYDMLFLVPPQMVLREDRHSYFKDLQLWTENGISLYDGTDERLRDEYPIKVEECRMYQYDSCRGLEGWVVVCMQFDEFMKYKKEYFKANYKPNPNIIASEDEQLNDFLWMWTMLPFTRAIDTLVITLENPETETGEMLKKIADANPDIVSWEI